METVMPDYLFYYWAGVIFVFGSLIGSFLNVVIARLPNEESIIFPASKCPLCGHSIRFHDNIPLVSYVWLGGRCRDCGSAISLRYPLVELAAASLALLLYLKWGFGATFLVFAIFCAAQIVVFFIDLDHMIIPDAISLNCLPIGLSAAIMGFIPGLDWKYSFAGAFLGAAVLYIPAVLYEFIRGDEGLGGGDVKLLAMIGAFTGPYGVIFVLLVSSIAGSLVGIAAMVIQGTGGTTRIPFGPFLSGAAILYLFAGPQLLDRFLSLWLDYFGRFVLGALF